MRIRSIVDLEGVAAWIANKHGRYNFNGSKKKSFVQGNVKANSFHVMFAFGVGRGKRSNFVPNAHFCTL